MDIENSPYVLAILDGWGISKEAKGDAIVKASTPTLDKLITENPHTELKCSGRAVGLPPGYMGNSEVGHIHIGAGRIVWQSLEKIFYAIEKGRLADNPALVGAFEHVKKNGSTLHMMGLLSDGGVHSHIDHLEAILRIAKDAGVEKIVVHPILDGRDTPPRSAGPYIERLEGILEETGGRIGTIAGRYYTMDRDNRWERIEKSYWTMVGEPERTSDTAARALEEAYARGETDEFVYPTAINDADHVQGGDSLFFFNFRPDRAKEISHAFTNEDFYGFHRHMLEDLYFVGMFRYGHSIDMEYLFQHDELTETLGEVISKSGLTQARIAETEKYAHVTSFLNGTRQEPYNGEERILVPSPKVATYDLKPEMSAPEVADKVVKRIRAGKHPLIIVNFANCDMVGHTGKMDKAVIAVETVDKCMARIVEAVEEKGGTLLVTADHGNAEKMETECSECHTAHTTNPVPFVYVGKRELRLKEGGLSNIAPTLLELMGLDVPDIMDESLIED